MQTTLAHMLTLLERPLQEKVTRNRQRLVDYANRIRQKFYYLYREYEMEVDVTECFEVQEFKGVHCHTCGSDFYGVTLPNYMNTVEALWWNRVPVDLYSKWRETKVGLKTYDDCLRASYDQPGSYCTERDIACCDGTYLRWVLSDPRDDGKIVEVSYTDPSGESHRERLTLTSGGPVVTGFPVMALKSVVLPSGRVGTVKVRQSDNNRVLSEYLPHELVPSYKRIKITGVCSNDQVTITANRAFQPVFYDTDIVETDNQDAIINAAYHIFYAESGPEQGMIQKAAFHENLMKESLKGEASRNIGINRENDTGRFGPPVKRARLYGNLGSHSVNLRSRR